MQALHGDGCISLVSMKLPGQVFRDLSSSVAGTERSTFNYLEHSVTVVGEY